jgi:hypothetical protein
MSDHHARSARDDVYDHEDQEPRSGRRRRPVADWGVGEDMFEHMPRNRFSRTAEAPPRERRFAREDADRRPHRDEDGDARGSEDTGPALDARAAREDAPAEPGETVPRGGVDDGRRTIRVGKDEDLPSEIAAIAADRDIPVDEPPTPAAHTGEGLPERRTVKIGGRPEGSLEAARYQRDRARRPPRTTHERIGARPDRIAMWAFALGLLLIIIAVLSAM